MASSNAFKLYLPPHPSSSETSTVHYPSMKDYIKTGQPGEGGCAVVFRARNRFTGMEVAVKKIERTDDDTNIAGELKVLTTAWHENIIKLHEFLWSSTNFYFILELANAGSLMERCPLPEVNTRMFFKQIISGASHLHILKIAHLDMKPENILIKRVSGREIATITDFGISQMPGDVVNRHEGTPEYMAPEVHLGYTFNGYQADLWSMGVTLYLMLIGRLPFFGKHAEDSQGLEESIIRAAYPRPENLPGSAQCLLEKLLRFEPSDRHCLEKLMQEDEWVQLNEDQYHR